MTLQILCQISVIQFVEDCVMMSSHTPVNTSTIIKCLTCLPTLRCWRCRANMTSLLLVFLQITIDYGYNRLPSLSKQFVSRIQQNFIFYLDTVFAWSKHIIFYLHSHKTEVSKISNFLLAVKSFTTC